LCLIFFFFNNEKYLKVLWGCLDVSYRFMFHDLDTINF